MVFVSVVMINPFVGSVLCGPGVVPRLLVKRLNDARRHSGRLFWFALYYLRVSLKAQDYQRWPPVLSDNK